MQFSLECPLQADPWVVSPCCCTHHIGVKRRFALMMLRLELRGSGAAHS